MDLLRDVELKGEPWSFERWSARVGQEQQGSQDWLLQTGQAWTVPEGLRAKVREDGSYKPFFGETVVFPITHTALQEQAHALYAKVGDILAEPLNPEQFHLTLHDLSSGPVAPPGHQAACQDILGHLPPLDIEMVSTALYCSVNISVVLGFAPRTDRDYRTLMNTYTLFDRVVYLSYWLRPHITLAYLKPRPLQPDERRALHDACQGLPPIGLTLTRPAYWRFSDMNHYSPL